MLLASIHVCITTAKSCTSSANDIIPVLVAAVVGAAVGAILGFVGTWLLRRGEHSWQEARETNQRAWEQQREDNQRGWQEARETNQRAWDQQREDNQRGWETEREVQAREWQAEQQKLAHDRDVAWQQQRDWWITVTEIIPPLDAALVTAQRHVEGLDVTEGKSRWTAAHTEWEAGWIPYSPHLGDDELEQRYKAVGTILKTLDVEDHESVGIGPLVSIVMRAIVNARIARAYSRRRDAVPQASFPSPETLIELLGQGEPAPFVHQTVR